MEAYDSRDFTIHLKDAALYVLMRWKWLLSAALAGAILLTVVQYVTDIGRYRSETPAVTLTAEERAHVAAALSYEAAYRRLCAYNEGAPLMHIDPAAAPTRQMRLLVTGENALAAAGLYRDFMTAQALYREVAEHGAHTAYMAELVTAVVENEAMQAPSRQTFLSVQVIAPTEETCARLSAVVYRHVEEMASVVTEAVGAHVARWVVDRYAVVRDETLATRQQASFEEQTRLGEQAATARQGLTAREIEVYRRQLEGVSDEERSSPPAVSRRAWLWGFLLGGGIGLAALAVGYLFCGRVLSAADVVSRHKVAVLGVLGKSRPLQDTAEDGALVWRRLAVTAQRQGVTRLFVSAESEEGWGDLSARLVGYGITLSVGASPAVDGGGAQALAACDGCVLALQWGIARHDRVAQEIALARQWEIPVLGVLLWQ